MDRGAEDEIDGWMGGQAHELVIRDRYSDKLRLKREGEMDGLRMGWIGEDSYHREGGLTYKPKEGRQHNNNNNINQNGNK